MSDTTPRLALAWLMPAQAQKHVTVNETFGLLDALVQCKVCSCTLSAQPVTPAEGDAYILPSVPTGESWSNYLEADLVYFQDGAWHRVAPRTGLMAWVEDQACFYVCDNSSWSALTANFTQFDNLSALGVGTISDSTNVFAAKLNNALWTAKPASEGGSGDLRYTLNKDADLNTLCLLFQTNWQGYAEIGLAGNNDLTFKVSSDGESWKDILVLKSANGNLSLPNLPETASGLSTGDIWNDAGVLKVV